MKPTVALVAAAALSGCISVQDKNGGSRFIKSESPTQMGAAIFTKEIGPQDNAVIFEIIDLKRDDKPVNIGLVGDESFKGLPPKAAVWSKDGSVIAVQGADFQRWSHAYDFKKHDYAISHVYPLEKRADSIEKLLKSRGGAGPKVLADWQQFDKVARPVGSQR